MKNIRSASFRFLTLSVLLGWSFSVRAAEIKAPWNQVCQVADGHELTLTMIDGNVVDGHCISISVNEIEIRNKDNRVVKVARSTLARLQMQRSKGHQLSSLGKGMRQSFQMGVALLFSPYAPAGLVVVPATVAWGAIAAPFCLLGDLANKGTGQEDIKVL